MVDYVSTNAKQKNEPHMLAGISGQTLDTVCFTKLRGWFKNLTETF